MEEGGPSTGVNLIAAAGLGTGGERALATVGAVECVAMQVVRTMSVKVLLSARDAGSVKARAF